jgi:hypothetical protein
MADPSKADTTMNTTNKDDLLALNDLSFAVLPLVQEMMDCAQHGRADALLQYRQAVFQQLDAIKAYAEAADGKDIALSAQEGEIDLLREKIQSKGYGNGVCMLGV